MQIIKIYLTRKTVKLCTFVTCGLNKSVIILYDQLDLIIYVTGKIKCIYILVAML